MSATKIKQRALNIKGMIMTTGLTPIKIARALKVDRKALSQCLNINPKTGDFILKDPYIREGIARYLRKPYQVVWGEHVHYPDTSMRRAPFFKQSSQEA